MFLHHISNSSAINIVKSVIIIVCLHSCATALAAKSVLDIAGVVVSPHCYGGLVTAMHGFLFVHRGAAMWPRGVPAVPAHKTSNIHNTHIYM